MSLVEVMTVTGILAVTVIAFATLNADDLRSLIFNRAQQSRDFTVSSLRNLISSPGVLYWSAVAPGAPNPDFAACVLGNQATSGNPAPCRANQDFPLQSFFPNTTLRATGSGGSPARPVYYDFYSADPCGERANGVQDATASSICPLAVTSTFRAQCPNGAGTCLQAQFVQITFTVRKRGSGGNIGAVESVMAAIRDASETVMVDTSLVALFKSQDGTGSSANGCGPGEVALGFDGTGNLFCQRMDYACPAGYYTVGLDPNMRPIYDLGTRRGQFGSGLSVRCAKLDCDPNVMISMFNSSGQLEPECLSQPRTCPTSESQVMIGIEGDGTPSCSYIDSCDEVSRDGVYDASNPSQKKNFTRGFQVYNGKFTGTNLERVGVVKGRCEPFKCGLNQYMRRWDTDGQCYSN